MSQSNRLPAGYRRRRMREIIAILTEYKITQGITPEKLTDIIEALGPTYIKLGQIVSMRQDILSAEYCDALMKLHTNVSPMPFEEVLEVLDEQYPRGWRHVFKSIDPVPLGSASIAQVHRAVLLEDGSDVVVKVQRPNIYNTMAEDVAIMERASGLFKIVNREAADVIDLGEVVREMWGAAQQELDFMVEAHHAEDFYNLNDGIEYITSPIIYKNYTTSKVLVMNYIGGTDIDKTDALKAQGYDIDEISTKLCNNYIKQVITDGFFQADPHPGNIRINGGKIAWLDMGMMGNLSRHDRTLLAKAIESVATGNVEELKNAFLMLGKHNGRINHSELYMDIDDMLQQYGKMDLSEINLGDFMNQMLTISAHHHISMPEGITMLGRGIVTLESLIAHISPNTNMVAVMVAYITNDGAEKMDWKEILKKLAKKEISAGSAALEIPVTLSQLLSSMQRGQSKLNIAVTGSEEPLAALSAMVNRIVMCIITASLLIGSSFIATTNMTPKILGIPALGAIGYFVSFLISLVIMFQMLRQQRRLDGRKRKK